MKSVKDEAKVSVLEQLLELMEGKMLSGMKRKPSDEDEGKSIGKTMSIEVIGLGEPEEDDEEDEDPMKAKLRKLFAKE